MALRYFTKFKSIRAQQFGSCGVLANVSYKNYGVLAVKKEENIFANNKFRLSNNFLSIRSKYDGKKGSGKQQFEEDSDEEEFADDVDKQKIAKVRVQSMRADLLLKAGLGVARNKIEAAFYESKIRLNGKKINKKSVHCKEGDVLDIIRSESPNNPNHWIVGRIEIMAVKTDGEEFIYVTMKRFKSLAVEKDDMK